MSERIDPVLVHADGSAVFHRELDRGYPLIERGEGMWLVDTDGNRYLDAVGGGAMVASLGAGAADVVAAAAAQLGQLGFIYNQQFTSPAQESLAAELTARAPDGIVEGVESDSNVWWVMAVQWHPEELIESAEAWDRQLFAAFAQRVRERSPEAVSLRGASAPRRTPAA